MSTPSSSLPLDATARVVAPGDRALVLGGGGAAGNAWLIGVLAGLADTGLDVTTADLTVGTSAGATAAAQLGGATPAELFAATLEPAPAGRQGPGPRPGHAGAGQDPVRAAAEGMARTQAIIDAASDVADMRRRLGAAALDLEAASDGSWSTRWRAIVGRRLPRPDWPDRTVALTAVDARTGEPVVLDRRSGVDLVDAVAASCSSGLPYAIGEGGTSTAATGATRTPTWPRGTLACSCSRRSGDAHATRVRGAPTWRPRSTSCGRAAAPSRPSSRTKPVRPWSARPLPTRRSVRSPPARGTSRAGRWPTGSARSGADGTSRPAAR